MREVICSECGKIWVCEAEYDNLLKRDLVPEHAYIPLCTKCDNICAECYAKKVGSKPELVREMNPHCYPKYLRVINSSRRRG